MRALEGFCAGRSFEEQGALEDHYDALNGSMYAALRELLRAAAPDVGALAVKLDLVVAHEVGTLSGGEACLAAIRADAHRLAQRHAGA